MIKKWTKVGSFKDLKRIVKQNDNPQKCKSCGQKIIWRPTGNGGKIFPFDLDSDICHFDTCVFSRTRKVNNEKNSAQ